LIAFDAERAEITCEAGVELGELVRLFLPRGFLVPACPGSAQVTVGGAVANDVHGKNQVAEGCFGHHVRWIDLVLASAEVVRTSPTERRDLFEATIGGSGSRASSCASASGSSACRPSRFAAPSGGAACSW
jgi:decaprenylphospho-beta-D-ribofuranose 2-oxidase